MLTSRRARYEDIEETLSQIMGDLAAQIEPELTELFHLDSIQFDRVIQARRARDAAKDDKPRLKKLSQKAREELRIATETPLQIARLLLRLCEHAIQMFDLGFQSARGDSVVAITSAHAAAGGAIAIVYLNLSTFRGSRWALETRQATDDLASEWEKLNKRVNERLEILRDAAVASEAGR